MKPARPRLTAPTLAAALLLPLSIGLSGCGRNRFPTYPPGYREFAYVSNTLEGTVTALDLVYLRKDRVIPVGRQPTGMAVNPLRNEVYAVNTGSNSVSVIDTTDNRVAQTIGVQHSPVSIAVSPDGRRAYVANAASNTVSVIDLQQRRQIAVSATGEDPSIARVAPDNRTLVVSNHAAGSLSIYTITGSRDKDSKDRPLQFREAFPGCPGATDVAVVANSAGEPQSGSKAFVACTGSHQIMVVWLAASPSSWRGRQDASLRHDQLLCTLDVGKSPTHLAVKPDGGEVFSTNFGSDSISEISTWTNEVLGTYMIGSQPSSALVSANDSSLWVTDYGADSATMYSIDDGHVEASVHTGSHPGALAFSADEHLLLAADTGSADIAVIRMQGKDGPTLFTLLPSGGHANALVIKTFRARR